jgi:hypothetical protein
MGVHHSVIDRLMQRLQATGMVDEHLRSDCPRKTTINCVCLSRIRPDVGKRFLLEVQWAINLSSLGIDNKGERIPQGQSEMDNPEKLAT